MFLDNENSKIAQIGDRNNFLVYVNNLSQAIVELLSSDSQSIKLRCGSRKKYLDEYTLFNMMDNYKKLFQSYLEKQT